MAIKLCSLASGSSGNCIYVGGDRTGLLVDCGVSGKEILANLKNLGVCTSTIKGILVTHEHSDHIRSVGILSRKLNVPVYANLNTWNHMSGSIGDIRPENVRIFTTGEAFMMEEITVESYGTPHDAAESVGFCFYAGNKKVSVATDLGYFSDGVRSRISGSELVLLESNHDVEMLKVGRYPYFLKRRILSDQGHLSNEAAGLAIYELLKSGVKEILLGHLSKENNFPELAYETVKGILAREDVVVGRDIGIDLAPRNGMSKCYHIE